MRTYAVIEAHEPELDCLELLDAMEIGFELSRYDEVSPETEDSYPTGE
jgi:hypothetical protein